MPISRGGLALALNESRDSYALVDTIGELLCPPPISLPALLTDPVGGDTKPSAAVTNALQDLEEKGEQEGEEEERQPQDKEEDKGEKKDTPPPAAEEKTDDSAACKALPLPAADETETETKDETAAAEPQSPPEESKADDCDSV
jgi:hypothetical protein